MTVDDVRVALRSARLRVKPKLTQAALAEAAGVEQATISKIERVGAPLKELQFETVRKIVEDGFKLTLGSFLADIDSQTYPDRQSMTASDKIAPSTHGESKGGGDVGTSVPAAAVDLQTLRDFHYAQAQSNLALTKQLDQIIRQTAKTRVGRPRRTRTARTNR